MKQLVTRGIVLTRTDYGEADRILTILTEDQGKIRVIAKGVRKIKSKLAGGIELFSVSQITFINGKSDISTLISSRLEKHYGNIVNDINRTMFAYEVLKNINRITEDNTGPEYFDLLQETLKSLDDFKIDQLIIQFWLNLQSLKLSGHTPNLNIDSRGKKLEAESRYNFDVSKMSFIVNPLGTFSQQHIKLFRLGVGLSSPKALSQVVDVELILPSCLQLSKVMINQFINS